MEHAGKGKAGKAGSRGSLRTAIAGAVAMMSLAPAALAAPVHRDAFRPVELADAELGEMRGRFVSQGEILYFGVEMYTQWTAAGEVYVAGLNIGIDRSQSSFRPTVTIVRIADIRNTNPSDTATGAAAGRAISQGGLDAVQGVGQVVQVTGDANLARNNMMLTVRSYNGTPLATAGGTAGSATAVDPQSGAVASATVANNSLGVAVTVPGQGTAMQGIAGSTGMRQLVQVTGDMNNVVNTLSLTAEVGRTVNTITPSLSAAINTMRGLPQIGRY